TYQWRAVTNGDNDRPAAPYAGEKLVYFHASQSEQRITTLISPVLELEAGQTYLMDFRHYQAPWDGDQDWLKVLVRPAGASEWTEVASWTDEATDWMQRRVEIPFSEPVQIAFQGISNYGYGIGVDEVKVYSGAHCNGALDPVSNVVLNNFTETTMAISWSMPVSTNVLVLMRKNEAVSDLPVGGVTYTANAQFGEGDQFPDGSSVVYAGHGNSMEITGLDHTSDYHLALFSYTDIGCYALDAVRANYATVQVFYPLSITVRSDGQPLEGALVTFGEEQKWTDLEGKVAWSVGHADTYRPLSVEYASKSLKSVTLSWDPLIDENFDGYAPFSLNLAGWVMEDKDQLKTYRFGEGLSFINESYIGSFIVLDPYYEGLLQADFDMTAYSGRHVLAAFACKDGANDDWLISPELEVFWGDGFSFMARSLSNTYGLESFRVLVADQTEGTGEFELLSAATEQVPVGWTAFSYDLSAYAGKRVKLAIQYVSNNTHALLLDQISVGPYTAPAPELVSKAVIHSVSAKRVSSVERELTADKPTLLRAEGAELSDKGRIGYGIKLNGAIVGETTGFSATTFSVNVDDCLGNEFQIQSKDGAYSAGSAWSTTYLVNACHAVLFVVYDNDNQPIEGALVKFEAFEALTDANGEVLFLGVENLSEASFEVSANGFMPESSQLDVLGDLETFVVLEPVLADSTSVRNEDIRLFPNPVSDHLYVRGIYGEIQVAVYDLSGRNIKRLNIETYNTFSLPVSDLQTGVYLVKFSVGGKAFIQKMMKR
ncbi:MAG: T9SS type A sorting domain-containing protein, partial [Bacteroidales bacterium]|nr:T9SS type A sorting domain-containing protein [Bacteroidales bacterium]